MTETYRDNVYVLENQHITVRTHLIEYHCPYARQVAHVEVARWEIFVNGQVGFEVFNLEDLSTVFRIIQQTIESVVE